jgi:hypothetical protein
LIDWKMVIVIFKLKFLKIFSSKGTLIFVLRLIPYKNLWKTVLDFEKICCRRHYQSAKKNRENNLNFFSADCLRYLELIFWIFFFFIIYINKTIRRKNFFKKLILSTLNSYANISAPMPPRRL